MSWYRVVTLDKVLGSGLGKAAVEIAEREILFEYYQTEVGKCGFARDYQNNTGVL